MAAAGKHQVTLSNRSNLSGDEYRIMVIYSERFMSVVQRRMSHEPEKLAGRYTDCDWHRVPGAAPHVTASWLIRVGRTESSYRSCDPSLVRSVHVWSTMLVATDS